jgi:Rrf2 family iron-sulfur cluster assembly transcriptional regulator
MIFSKATGYGIRALAYMASQPEHGLFGLQEIAEHEDIPPAYLRKVLGELRRHRFLRSVKGIHGGYELGRAPEAITLWEVFSLLEADPYMDMCILGNKVCGPESSCAFHDDWQRVRKDLVALLQNRTIAEAAAEISKPKGLENSLQIGEAVGKNHDGWKDEDDAIPSPA